MIKNFIYLNEDKMYSLSSQLFEGVTEYVLNESSSTTEDSEEQKGPVGSGKLLGDILKNSERNTVKKFLNDYSYNIFENELENRNKISIITKNSDKASTDNVNYFIKITSRAIFNDMTSILDTLKNFNDIGKAITYVTRHKEISNANEEMTNKIRNTKNRNERAKKEQRASNIKLVERFAKENGMQHDEEYLDYLSYILNYGFKDQLEIQMRLNNRLFSASLNRSFLRDSEEMLVKKYSRKTEVEFTLFGVVTQSENQKKDDDHKLNSGNIKAAIFDLANRLTELESSFTGPVENEIIIDPIAIYTEI